MPGRYQFSLPERPARDGWFRIGTLDITTTALLVGLGVLSMFLYAIDRATVVELTFAGSAVRDGDLWRLVTWPLMNPPTQIWVILTLVFFWFFGHRIEDQIGRKRFTVLVATMTIVPAAIVTAVQFDASFLTYGLGLLGTGLLVVFALENPQAMFFFGIPAWVIALVFVGIDVLRLLGDRMYESLVLELLVIAVALVGARQFGLVQNLTFIPQVGAARRRNAPAARRARRARGGRSGVVQGPWPSSGPSPADQIELDLLLDKIAADGMDSLTRSEKQRLNDLSKRLRER